MSRSESPTDRQREVLKTIADFITANGFAPTVREIGELIDVESTQGVVCHLEALKKKGLLTWNERQARTIRILKG
jgi:repressor LexA